MAEEPATSSSPAAADLVLAVGASAAHPRSLERFIAGLQPQHGMAVVVILQHREALDEERFRRALAKAGREAVLIRDDAQVEAGKIYLPGANVLVTVDGRRFRTRPAEREPGERGTIDSFLVSLSRDEEWHAVAVLLEGTGGDGTLGFTAIKEAGGLALAEETAHSQEGDLAASNTPAALADFILPAEKLAERVNLCSRQWAERKDGPGAGPDQPEVAAALTAISGILRKQVGHDFHGYKRGTFLRRVQRRMQVTHADTLESYLEILRTRDDEALNLFNDLLIGVTQFFRDRREFEVLEREVIPKLFEGKGRNDQLRIWVIGCSTGEEAYSIAILLREHMATLDEVPHVQIFGSDLDGRALASARVGRFSAAIARDVGPERLARWFVKEGDTYCVAKELREMCIFSQHSIIKDPPFSRLDLVSCRNLLIYLDADLQSRVIPLFHFALKSGGYLFLGNAENASRHTSLFTPVEPRSRIFRRLDTATRTLPDFPFSAVDRRLAGSGAPALRPRHAEAGLARRAERIAERYAPAYVIVDEGYNILHFSGRTGRYLDPAGGAASLNLLNLVHSDLRVDLRTALAAAAEQGGPVQVHNLAMTIDGQRRTVDLVVEPIHGDPESMRGFMAIFREGSAAAGPDDGRPRAPSGDSKEIAGLETELRTTKERLQATIEELESTNEELKSSNEEYQSLNEELQSANEELETSKEELQSVNEELTTVNGELAHRVQELGRANSDLKNLLESTQIATIFLDNELRVTNCTPAISEVFHLIESDIGRPIGHIKPRVAYDELQDDVQRVLRTLGNVEREIENAATGTRFMVRVLPYRSVDNYIGGVVLTFTDITQLTQAQRLLRQSESHAKLLLAELQHRVRNTLAVVRAIARRTAEKSETVEEFAMHLDGRLDAFARIQAAVTRNPAGVLDLENLVADTLLAHAAHEGDRVRSIKGPKIGLRPKAAEMLALTIHELATNAVKYGALSVETGRVEVGWTVERTDGSGQLVLRWIEHGMDGAAGPPRRKGFGTELIERTLGYELGGEANLAIERDGLRCTIVLPLDPEIMILPGGGV